MPMSDKPPIEYAKTSRRRSWWCLPSRYRILLPSILLLVWSFAQPPLLVISTDGLPVTNERFAVLCIARDTPAENLEFVPYKDWPLGAGFRRVNWSGWHSGRRYLIVPRWAGESLAGVMIVASIVLVRRWALRTDGDPGALTC
jgi:hypothetical protein